MNGIERCPVCRYHEASVSGFTLLGTANACVDCIKNRAELPVEIHRAFQEAKRFDISPLAFDVGPFDKEAMQALRQATVWMGPHEGYFGLVEYEKRVAQQMPKVLTAEEIEDQELAKRMAGKIIKTSPRDDDFKRSTTVMERLKAWALDWWHSWEEAVNAGL